MATPWTSQFNFPVRPFDEYVLPWHGVHGVVHWARVFENGVQLAEQTGANVEVVKLFAEHQDEDSMVRLDL